MKEHDARRRGLRHSSVVPEGKHEGQAWRTAERTEQLMAPGRRSTAADEVTVC
jgi:hypothetical protein